MQPGGLEVLTSLSAGKACVAVQGPWAGTRFPKHTEKADGEMWLPFREDRDNGFKGKPPCGPCLHQYPAGLTAHGLRGSPYSVYLMGCKTIWGSMWLIQAA